MPTSGRSAHDRCMHTTTKLPRRTNTAPSDDPSSRGRRVCALGAPLFAGLMMIGVAVLPGGNGDAPSVGPPTWQEIAASTSTDVDDD